MIVCFQFAKWSQPVEPEIEEPLDREIVFRFVGGRVDGLQLSSRLRSEAKSLWVLTHGGRIGQEFRLVATSAASGPGAQTAMAHHYYKVTDRVESESQVTITSQFLPTRMRAMKFSEPE